MLNRIINWIKSLFHEETPEEQDKRIHETIKSWKEKVDKEELAYVDTYYDICKSEVRSLVMSVTMKIIEPPIEVKAEHLTLWDNLFPRIENKEDNALKAWTKWHEAHLMLANLYCFDVTDPPDGSQGQFNKHVDIRPAKWLKDLALEEQIIKALQIEANAKEYQV